MGDPLLQFSFTLQAVFVLGLCTTQGETDISFAAAKLLRQRFCLRESSLEVFYSLDFLRKLLLLALECDDIFATALFFGFQIL